MKLEPEDLALLDKRCERCDTVKPWTEFPLRHFSSLGETRPDRICKACMQTSRGLLPVEPFARWCRQRIAEEGIERGTFAARIGVPDRRLNEYVNERCAWVSVKTVDGALTRDGWHLSQVYPELYPDAPQDVIELLMDVADFEARESWEEEEAATLEGRVAA